MTRTETSGKMENYSYRKKANDEGLKGRYHPYLFWRDVFYWAVVNNPERANNLPPAVPAEVKPKDNLPHAKWDVSVFKIENEED